MLEPSSWEEQTFPSSRGGWRLLQPKTLTLQHTITTYGVEVTELTAKDRGK